MYVTFIVLLRNVAEDTHTNSEPNWHLKKWFFTDTMPC